MKDRIRSFGYAFRGIRTLVASETNARIHLAATAAVMALGIACRLSSGEWTAVILAVSTVWSAEAMNTAVERLADRTAPERHPLVRAAKDVAAAGVLIASLGALAVGLVVFLPRFA
ncbi:MAG: diacylglycerol kinase family protein [Candidatus Fermentibacter sp.]|nr:diacylglycerol kinase family protein [Candidatus Fermentibacter sp.]